MNDWLNQLRRLAELRDAGVLTDDEFTEQKSLILPRNALSDDEKAATSLAALTPSEQDESGSGIQLHPQFAPANALSANTPEAEESGTTPASAPAVLSLLLLATAFMIVSLTDDSPGVPGWSIFLFSVAVLVAISAAEHEAVD